MSIGEIDPDMLPTGRTPLVTERPVWHRAQNPMQRAFLTWQRQHALTSLMLALLLSRAYVPVGFIPANGTPFLLKLEITMAYC
jgi:hypothetical protein